MDEVWVTCCMDADGRLDRLDVWDSEEAAEASAASHGGCPLRTLGDWRTIWSDRELGFECGTIWVERRPVRHRGEDDG